MEKRMLKIKDAKLQSEARTPVLELPENIKTQEIQSAKVDVF